MSPVVSSGEIQSQEDLHGCIAQAGHILPFVLPTPKPYQIRAPRLIERIVKLAPAPPIEVATQTATRKYKSRYTQTDLPLSNA